MGTSYKVCGQDIVRRAAALVAKYHTDLTASRGAAIDRERKSLENVIDIRLQQAGCKTTDGTRLAVIAELAGLHPETAAGHVVERANRSTLEEVADWRDHLGAMPPERLVQAVEARQAVLN